MSDTFGDFMIAKAVKDDAEGRQLRASNREMLTALEYALECITRPDDVDVAYRMETVQRIKTAIHNRGGQ